MPAAAHQSVCHPPRRRTSLELPQARVDFLPGLLSPSRAAELLAALRDGEDLEWRSDEIRMFGRWVRQPRLTAWVADPGITYRYSGLTLKPQPWSPRLAHLRREIEAAAGSRFNSVLINQYRDGADHMGWHRDNERELGSDPVIASLSLGATRFFDLRHRGYRDNGLPVQRFTLSSGDLVVMRGATQRHWHHRVPRQLRSRDPRINLSFRQTAAPPRTPRN